jgi:hypothetical protein
MKYFIDTEFIEGFPKKAKWAKKNPRHFIDLISIGIVAEDGREYYAISNEYNYNDASQWVKENVILPLYTSTVHGDARNHFSTENFHLAYGKSNAAIAEEIKAYVFGTENPQSVEFVGYYADYDWVLFCSIFGTMMNLPDGFPMYCRDLKQTMDEANLSKSWKQEVCPDPEGEHDALVDARWNQKLYNAIMTKINSNP